MIVRLPFTLSVTQADDQLPRTRAPNHLYQYNLCIRACFTLKLYCIPIIRLPICLQVWDLATKACVLALSQKTVNKDSWPLLEWACDDSVVVHMVTNTLHCYNRQDGFSGECNELTPHSPEGIDYFTVQSVSCWLLHLKYVSSINSAYKCWAKT